MKHDKLYNFLCSLVAVAAIWLAWLIAYVSVKNDYVIPSVGATFREMGRLLGQAAFWRAFGGTVLRTVEAFFLSFALGLVLSLCALLSGRVRAFLAPVISLLRTVPTMALVLIFLLWTSPAAAPVLIAVLVLMPVFYASMLAALDEVKNEYGGLARAFKVGRARRAALMYLPLAAPPVLGQMGATFSLGLKITVSGEVLSVTARSLGGMMQQAQGYLEIPRLMALTLLTVFVGFLFEAIFWLISKAIVRWRA